MQNDDVTLRIVPHLWWTLLAVGLLVGCAEGTVPSNDAYSGGDVHVSQQCGPSACSVGETQCAGSHTVAECVRGPDGCGVFEESDSCSGEQVCQEGRCVSSDSCIDEDGDGYGEGCPKGADCDDTDESIHPNTVDICDDGIDQNCSGSADEGCEPSCPNEPCSPGDTRCTSGGKVEVCERDSSGCGAWSDPRSCPSGGECTGGGCSGCMDSDGDGFGTNCAAGSDCDDGDPSVNSGATELCDGNDNDCDGETDEDFSKLGTSCEAGRGACRRTGSFVCSSNDRSTTCDATAGQPEEEKCGDGVDNDCDGSTDEGFSIVGQACTRGQGECQTSGTFQCDPNDPTATFCDAPAPDSGSTEVCDGADNDCDGSTDEDGVCSTCVEDSFEENDRQADATDLTSDKTITDLRSCGPCDNGFDHDWFTLGPNNVGNSITIELNQPTGTNQNGNTHANLEIEMFCDTHFCDAIRGRNASMVGTFDGTCAVGSDCSNGSVWTFYVYPRCSDSPDGNPTIGTPYDITRR